MHKNSNTRALDTYLGLCTEVYELSKPGAPIDAYAFYKKYAKAANGLILEPMCGTGRFLLPLLEDGFSINAVELLIEKYLNLLHERWL